MIKDRVWGRVRKILKKVREEDNGDFWTDQILSMKEIAEGLELLERGYNAKVDREAELPENDWENGAMKRGWDIAQQDMLKKGWVKEVKE